MKKTILTLLAAFLVLPVVAQTNFRPLTLDEAVATAKAESKWYSSTFTPIGAVLVR